MIWSEINVKSCIFFILYNTIIFLMEILYKKENYILAKKVFIDPGHGGNDSGAVGINNLLEKDITLSVAKKFMIFLKNKV